VVPDDEGVDVPIHPTTPVKTPVPAGEEDEAEDAPPVDDEGAEKTPGEDEE
jgi:hypothetical protein